MAVRAAAGIQKVSHIPKDPLSASDIDVLNLFHKIHTHARLIIRLYCQVTSREYRFPFVDRKGFVAAPLQSFRRASVSSRNFPHPRLAGEICQWQGLRRGKVAW